MQNLLNKTNRFYKFLQAKYPCSMPIDLKVYKTTSIPDFTGECQLLSTGEIQIYVVQGKRSIKAALFTLGHEYGHAIQYDNGVDVKVNSYGADWSKEVEANFFAEKAIQEYKNWKGK